MHERRLSRRLEQLPNGSYGTLVIDMLGKMDHSVYGLRGGRS
ncbi:hypothetical protein [Thermalbibacter longus]|nr:hypothetical protein [Thermalbibacter longus]